MPETPPFRIHALELGPMENFIYLIEDITSGRAAAVDPAWEPAEILELARTQGLRITDILLTHSHHDHINALEDVLAVHDAQIHLTRAESAFWGKTLARPALHHGGERIRLGDTEIDILHTPGHTPGSACYKVGDELISGDTLFVFGCGRCDLAGGDPEQMFTTLNKLKQEMPASTVIHPGHNYAEIPVCTMQEEEEGNPFMHFEDEDEFVRYRMQVHGHVRSTPFGPVSRDEAYRSLRHFHG